MTVVFPKKCNSIITTGFYFFFLIALSYSQSGIFKVKNRWLIWEVSSAFLLIVKSSMKDRALSMGKKTFWIVNLLSDASGESKSVMDLNTFWPSSSYPNPTNRIQVIHHCRSSWKLTCRENPNRFLFIPKKKKNIIIIRTPIVLRQNWLSVPRDPKRSFRKLIRDFRCARDWETREKLTAYMRLVFDYNSLSWHSC